MPDSFQGVFHDDIVTGWLDEFAAEPWWVGLMTGDPRLVTNALALEVLGDAYRRVGPVNLSRVNKLLLSSTPFKWVGLPPQTRVAGIALWTDAFNGVWRSYVPVPGGPIDFPAGGNYSIDAGDVGWGIDS